MASGEQAIPEQRAALDGTWGVYTTDSDYMVVTLRDYGDRVTGIGCYDGLPHASSDPDFVARSCGRLVGRVDGRSVHFAFGVADFGGLLYTTDAFVARDEPRMAGTVELVHAGRSVAATRAVWLPMPTDRGWLVSELVWPEQIAWRDADYGGYDLTLSEPSSGTEFTAQQVYRIFRHRDGLAGDLGAFWASELRFETAADGELVLSAGPVAETAPDYPVRLSLRFASGELQRVDAETPSGASYTFSAARHPQ
jgi:hypothetical protein